MDAKLLFEVYQVQGERWRVIVEINVLSRLELKLCCNGRRSRSNCEWSSCLPLTNSEVVIIML